MDPIQPASDFADMLRFLRHRQTFRTAAKELGISVTELKEWERGTVIPDAETAYHLVDRYLGRDKHTRQIMLWLELGWLGLNNREVEDVLYDLVLGGAPFRDELVPDRVRARLKAAGLQDPAALERVIGFLNGAPGVWGRLVDGGYYPEHRVPAAFTTS